MEAFNRVKLTVISFATVQRDIERAHAAGKPLTTYNTAFHSDSEIRIALSTYYLSMLESDLTRPWVFLRPWLSLILASQQIAADSVHIVRLGKTYVSQLLHAGDLGTKMGYVGESDAEDLAGELPLWTENGRNVASLFSSADTTSTPDEAEAGAERVSTPGYFLRLDVCSPKDGPKGNSPVTRASDIWTRISYSNRAISAIQHQWKLEGPERPIEVFLLPWNKRMNTALEYRVFCPPPTGMISAVSQYR